MRVVSILFLPIFLLAGILDFQKISKAEDAYSKGDYKNSLKHLKSLKKDTPSYYYDLGNSYYKTANYKSAISAYKRAKGDGVDESARLHNLGNSYFKKGDLKKAIIAYEASLKIKENRDTRYNLEVAKKLLRDEKRKKRQKQNQNQKQNQKRNSKKSQSKKNSKKQNSKKQNQNQNSQKNQQKNQKNNQNQNQSQNQSNQNQREQVPKAPPKPKEQKSDFKPQNRENRGKKDRKRGSQKASAEIKHAKSISEKELKRLMKKMRAGKMPTMLYRAFDGKNRKDSNKKPW